MLRTLFCVGAVALTILVSTSRVSADTMFPAVGGRGDASFNDRCPAHQNLIGLAGRAGTYIDQVQIICAPMLANGTHGTKYLGPSHGGSGGTPLEFSCAGDSVVSGATLAMTKNDGHVAWIVLNCVSMRSGSQNVVVFGTKAYTPDWKAYTEQLCQAGELANGFNGRSGRDVNALGLDCVDRSELAVQNTQAPSAHVEPIKITGKPSLVCPQGYVWREASPSDHVCVTPLQRMRAAAQNAAAAAHVNQTDHTYGPKTCVSGYVWREAYVGDVVCVMPAERDAAKNENAQAPPQIPK
jgi:hypothetical protein